MKLGLVCLLFTGILLFKLQGHAMMRSQKSLVRYSATGNIHKILSPGLKRNQIPFALAEEFLLNDADDDDDFISTRKKTLNAISYWTSNPSSLFSERENLLKCIHQSHGYLINFPSHKYIFQRVIKV